MFFWFRPFFLSQDSFLHTKVFCCIVLILINLICSEQIDRAYRIIFSKLDLVQKLKTKVQLVKKNYLLKLIEPTSALLKLGQPYKTFSHLVSCWLWPSPFAPFISTTFLIIFLGLKQLTSVLVQTQKNVFFEKFCCKFCKFSAFFIAFCH